MIRLWSPVSVLLLAATVTANAATITADATAGTDSNSFSSNIAASAWAFDFLENEFGNASLEMFAHGSVRNATAGGWVAFHGDHSLLDLHGEAVATVAGLAIITGRTGPAYVEFSFYADASSGCISFEALGTSDSACGEDWVYDVGPVLFTFGEWFSYDLRASYKHGLWPSGEVFIELRDEIYVTDGFGNRVNNARLTIDRPSGLFELPEPSTFTLAAFGVAITMLGRSGLLRRR